MASPLSGEPLAYLQFSSGTFCEPRVNPFNLTSNTLNEYEDEEPILKVVGRENPKLANAKIALASGERPSLQEYVQQTEVNQLRMFESVRKKVRVGASKYKNELDGR